MSDVVDKPKVYIMYYCDHDGDHLIQVFDSQFKADYVLNQIQNMGLTPIPIWSVYHGHEKHAWFRNSLVIEEERVE